MWGCDAETFAQLFWQDLDHPHSPRRAYGPSALTPRHTYDPSRNLCVTPERGAGTPRPFRS